MVNDMTQASFGDQPLKPKKVPARCKIEDYYAAYLKDNRQIHLGRIYEETITIATNMVISQFGPPGRIRVDEVAHDVATSVLMNIIVKRKPVDNWFKLLKKISNNLTCRWMINHLYKRQNTWSLEGMDREMEEFRDEIPDHHVSYAEMESLQHALERTMDLMDGLLSSFRKPAEAVCAHTALELAVGEKPVIFSKMSPRQQTFTNILRAKIDRIMHNVTSSEGMSAILHGHTI